MPNTMPDSINQIHHNGQDNRDQHTQVLVIGGGVIGLAIAYECAKAGRSVRIIEKHKIGLEASQAAAGMLGAQVESHHPGPFYELCKASRHMYREWALELEAISGRSIEYVASGIVRVALTEQDEAELKGRLSWLGGDVKWLSAEEVCALEPAITADNLGGIYFAGDHQIQAPRLAEALEAALQKLGADIIEDTQIYEWLIDEKQISATLRGVRVRGNASGEHTESAIPAEVTDTIYTADQIVVAAGAWSAGLLAPLGVHLPIAPVKGQCYAARMNASDTPLIERTVFTKGCYIVPKTDGTLVIGATEEDSGFDKQINPSAVDRIGAVALTLLPELKDATFERTWTGLRPGSADGKPYLGKAPGWKNLYVAAGHYRNGILLTPISARLISELLLSGQSSIDLKPFSAERVSQIS